MTRRFLAGLLPSLAAPQEPERPTLRQILERIDARLAKIEAAQASTKCPNCGEESVAVAQFCPRGHTWGSRR